MVLPQLPPRGQDPRSSERNDWDASVESKPEGRLSDTAGVRVIDNDEMFLNVKDFGAIGSGHAQTDDTDAIEAAIEAAYAWSGIDYGRNQGEIRGATVFFPRGAYRTTRPLKYRAGVSLKGEGMRNTRLFNQVGDLFSWSNAVNTMVYDVETSDIWLSTGVGGGHIFSISGTGAGGMARASFNRVKMTTDDPAASIWKQRDSSQLIDVTWFQCIFDTTGSRTVPAFDILGPGNNYNSLQWLSSWCHGHNASVEPFFNVGSTSAWIYNLTFKDLVGEQNLGGFIHLQSVDGFVIDNCPDWDGTSSYVKDVYRFGYWSGTYPCKNGRISRSMRITSGDVNTEGVYDIKVGNTASGSILQRNIRIEGCNPRGEALKLWSIADVQVDGQAKGFVRLTAGRALTALDPDEIVFDSTTNVSTTLPTPASVMFGRQYNIKNIGVGTVTITNTVDGVTGRVLNRWDKVSVRTDGLIGYAGGIWFTV